MSDADLASLQGLSGKELGQGIVTVVKAYVERKTAPLIARIAELEKALGEAPSRGMTPDDIAAVAKGFAPAVKNFVSANQAPVLARLETLERHVSAGVTGGVVDRAGHLILTLADGTQKDFGCVVGRDVDRDDVARQIREEVAKFPKPRDAFGFEDLSVHMAEDERTMVRRFVRGEHTKEFAITLPIVLDCGVWKQDRSYSRGSAVTWAGSLFIAQQDTTSKPDSGDGAWRLSVKRGANGKDGVVTVKEPPPPIRVAPPPRQ